MASKGQSFHFQNQLIGSSSTLPTKTSTAPQRDAAHTPLRAWRTRPLFAISNVRERIASNLFLVVESPQFVFSAESQFQTEQEVVEACGGAGPLPFLLKGTTLYTLSPLTKSSILGRALKEGTVISQELFAEWRLSPQRSKWTIELLNRFLRLHAWKRGLRFDEGHALFYFTRSKPKKLWWEVGGRIAQREVTAPNLKHYQVCGQQEVEFQSGWKHEAIRAGFELWRGCLFVQLEPAWFLTELDGKTPATSQRVAPLNSSRSNQDVEKLPRALCFWSAVFAKGHRELRIETGGGPIRVRMVCLGSSPPRIVSKEDPALDYLAVTNVEDDGPIPELGFTRV